ncbi:putative membrane protein [Halobacteriovorax marinus SJ]|uniref:Membrane protein n=1 Tax=Halobacteriovorax marinus (strain ATCC BAA-682 / DSM 15412 / SJ) TaxID=862908 RepID=E1X3X9_HALMS|nr:hypothetical protein [Halobacteriovorax marinus]CBW25319.1 putative membrane protein [Halobacteriovorax marinus SJ]
MKFKLLNCLSTTAFMLALASCGGSSSGGSSAGGTSGSTIKLVDPYIVGGTMFWDKNNNGKLDSGEPVSGASNASGVAQFSVTVSEDAKLIQLAKGVSGGKPFKGKLKVKFKKDKNFATPITTMRENGYDDDDILALVNDASGLSFSSVDDLINNPMEAVDNGASSDDDLDLLKATMAVTNLLNSSEKGFDATPTDLDITNAGIKTKFKDSADVYERVVTKAKLDAGSDKAIKTAVAVQTYIDNAGVTAFGGSGSISTGDVDAAITQLETAYDGASEDVQELELKYDGSNFVSEAREKNNIPNGTYDYIKLNLKKFSRTADEAGDFWGPNMTVSVDFGQQAFRDNNLVLDDDEDEFSSTFDSSTGLLTVKLEESITDGATIDWADITFNNSSSGFAVSEARGAGVYKLDVPVNGVFRAYGTMNLSIDWMGAMPQGDGNYVVDKSVNNHCIDMNSTASDYTDDTVVRCSTHSGNASTGKFSFVDEEVRQDEFYNFMDSSLDEAAPSAVTFTIEDVEGVFTLDTITTSDKALVVGRNSSNSYDVLELADDSTKDLDMSFSMSFSSKYDGSFPSSYPIKLIANTLKIKKGTTDLNVAVNSTGFPFYKGGFMYIPLDDSTGTFTDDTTQDDEFRFLLLDTKSKKGYAISTGLNGYMKLNEVTIITVTP